MSAAAWIAILATAAIAALAGLWIRERRTARRLREELATAQRRADRTATAQATFFDLVTHELRSPMAAILGYQELLQEGAYGDLEPGASDALDRMARSARHLLNLIDGVVELSQLRAGILSPDLSRVSPGMLVATAAESFRTHARDRDIPAQVEAGAGYQTIWSDQGRLARALDLIVTSAVKYPGTDGLRFHARPLHGDDGPPGLSITLSGLGLRTDPDADDPALRLGLRLAVARRIATLLGGGLEMDFDPDDDARVLAMTFRVRSLDPPGTPDRSPL